MPTAAVLRCSKAARDLRSRARNQGEAGFDRKVVQADRRVLSE
jgi:hypothetical protein